MTLAEHFRSEGAERVRQEISQQAQQEIQQAQQETQQAQQETQQAQQETEERIQKAALNFLRTGLSAEQVAQGTGLSLEDVEVLYSKNVA